MASPCRLSSLNLLCHLDGAYMPKWTATTVLCGENKLIVGNGDTPDLPSRFPASFISSSLALGSQQIRNTAMWMGGLDEPVGVWMGWREGRREGGMRRMRR